MRAFSIVLTAILLSGCLFSVEDGTGTSYPISPGGIVDVSAASEADINSLVLTGWFQPAPFPRAANLRCRSTDGGLETIAWFENVVRDGFYVMDLASELPGAFNAMLHSECQRTDEGNGVVSYDLYINIRDPFSPASFSRYAPIMSPANTSCTLAEMTLGNPLLVAAGTCLAQDPRSPTDPWGMPVFPPQAINLLKLLLDETVATNPTPPEPEP